jgi:hypothetical protein
VVFIVEFLMSLQWRVCSDLVLHVELLAKEISEMKWVVIL